MADDRPKILGENPPEFRIAEALARLREMLEGTNTRIDVEKATGIPAGTLKDYFSGRSVPPLDRFLKIIAVFGISPEAFFREPLAASDQPIVDIPVLDVKAAAGSGHVQDVISAVDVLPMPRAFLARLATPDARLSSLRCSGDSMQPTITHGALMIIDESQTTLPEPRAPYRKSGYKKPEPDGIYVFLLSEDLRLKRLRKLESEFVAIFSDNHLDHPIEIVRPRHDGALKIIGKVIWWDNRL